MPTCASLCHYVPTWANIAVCSCAEKDSLCGTVVMAWINAMVFAQAPPKAKVIFAGLLRKAFPQKHAFVDMSVFLWLRKQRPRFAQGQPKGYFQMKELDKTTEAIVPMNEMWRKLNANMRQYVPLGANMGQHCSLSAVQRKTAFVEQS